MKPSDNAIALANAVLAGNDMAVAGLVDCVLEELDLTQGKALLEFYDDIAKETFYEMSRQRFGVNWFGTDWKQLAECVYDSADKLIAERAKRLRRRAKKNRPEPAS